MIWFMFFDHFCWGDWANGDFKWKLGDQLQGFSINSGKRWGDIEDEWKSGMRVILEEEWLDLMLGEGNRWLRDDTRIRGSDNWVDGGALI